MQSSKMSPRKHLSFASSMLPPNLYAEHGSFETSNKPIDHGGIRPLKLRDIRYILSREALVV